MILAFDFDGTWTADTPLFRGIVTLAQQRGHTCLVVTNRASSAEALNDLRPIRDLGLPIIWAAGRPKREMALSMGYRVDVWIDDNPILVDKGVEGMLALGYQHS